MVSTPTRLLFEEKPSVLKAEDAKVVFSDLITKQIATTATALFMENIKRAREKRLRTKLRELMEGLHLHNTVRQEDFWEVYDQLLEESWSDLYFISKNKNWVAVEPKDLRRSAKGPEKVEAYLSSKARIEVLSVLEYFYENYDDDVSIADLRVAFATEVAKRVVIRIRFGCGGFPSGVPSTEVWVHSFMLWTGISPPVSVTTRVLPFTKSYTGVTYVPRYRPQSAYHRRGRLDRWHSPRNGEGRSSHRASSTRCQRSERCERLCRTDGFRRPPHHPDFRQVGVELRYGQCRP